MLAKISEFTVLEEKSEKKKKIKKKITEVRRNVYNP